MHTTLIYFISVAFSLAAYLALAGVTDAETVKRGMIILVEFPDVSHHEEAKAETL